MMFDKNKTEIIVAGPGVGKTTELLNRIEKALLDGVPPQEIAFFSFSTTAVDEGLDRITARMEAKKTQFKYFRTLHSMAFYLLGLNSKQVMSIANMNQFARENDLKIGGLDYNSGAPRWQTPDSILLSQIDSARLLGMSIREYFAKNHIDDVPIERAEDIATKYQRFKLTHGLLDFTDMILYANKTDFEAPHFQYMFIDEAQDLSTQQWKFVEKLAKNADNVVIVGDERQAIAEFAGADVEYFLKIKGKITELNQSYRVPREIHKLARKVEKKMTRTRNAMWYPRPKNIDEEVAGEVIRVSDLPIREMKYGSWLVLTRTNSQLMEFREYLMQNCNTLAAFFLVDGEPPVDTDVFKAISIFNAVNIASNSSKYDFIVPTKEDSPALLKKKIKYTLMLKKFMSSKNPVSAELDSVFMHRFNYSSWFDAFDKIPLAEKKYINAILPAYQRKPKAFAGSKIRLSTIHSSKGTEADNVVLYTQLTGKVYNDWKQYSDTNDTEVKVLFVGITRARKRLYLLGQKKTKFSYDELLG